MRIEFLEIMNFRKLRAVRIDIAQETTLFVGANNSGKTSAMVALRRFLVDRDRFNTNDLTASHWQMINATGEQWTSEQESVLSLNKWAEVLPTLDVWLHVEQGEFHRVSKLIPTLSWEGGLLGVRLRFEPKDIKALHRDYVTSASGAETVGAAVEGKAEDRSLKLWPENMMDFLTRRLRTHFAVRAYLLDPDKVKPPDRGQAQPQLLTEDAVSVDGDPFAGLIRIDEINAQRGFGQEPARSDTDEAGGHTNGRRLSDQLQSYYIKHLDPTKNPETSDLEALTALAEAQRASDKRLGEAFHASLNEVQQLGYPGVSDPKLKISTRIQPTDGLNHDAAVQYELSNSPGKGGTALRLPEDYNGLGYQNLISMVFRLMSFRDAWMRVGKASNPSDQQDASIEPLHLVLIEEPEAHLHAQVQQVFIRQAYAILRKHPTLEKTETNKEEESKEPHTHMTQVLVSTHSSHVAHEVPYASLRYFRRMPADGKKHAVPFSTVVNLSSTFGAGDETARFVTRYLRAFHCDLFFADAVILVEGAAERMLIPHFMRRPEHSYLMQCYVTLLEIGGSHAFRMRPLIEALGVPTLVVTDLDAAEKTKDKSRAEKARPARRKGQVTTNSTLKSWVPKLNTIDELLDTKTDAKVSSLADDDMFKVRVAYQSPIMPDGDSEVLPSTFEDALAFNNLEFFKDEELEGGALLRHFCEDVNSYHGKSKDLAAALFDRLTKGTKAEFALDVLASASGKHLSDLKAPVYIEEGLIWLQEHLKRCRQDTPVATPPTADQP